MTLSDSSVLTDSVSLCGGESDKGLSGSTGQGALLRSLLLLWLCRGEVKAHRTLDGAGWDLWIFWSSELELELEGSCELEPRGLVARLAVNLNLRLFCNWWAMRALHECFFMQCCSWGCLHNGVYKKLNKCLSLRNVFITLLGILF